MLEKAQRSLIKKGKVNLCLVVLFNKAKPSNYGKLLKTNLPSCYSNVINGTGNDLLYGKNDLYE